jgi:hypothetical protein
MTDVAEKLTPFQKWYAKEDNKLKLADARKKRYRDDPTYRTKALQNAATQRAKVRDLKDQRPAHYSYPNTEVVRRVGISVATLRLWRDRRYYPQPFAHRGRIYFTLEQVALLEGLAKFFRDKGRRLKPEDLVTLENLVNYIHANW